MLAFAEPLALELCEGGADAWHFAAQIQEGRPDMKGLQQAEQLCASALPRMQKHLQHSKCPVAWAGWFADEIGIMMIIALKRPTQVSHAKKDVKALLPGDDIEGARKVANQLEQLDSLHAAQEPSKHQS